MDLKLLKMLCKDRKQHHVMFHELYSVSSLLCIEALLGVNSDKRHGLETPT